MFFKINKIQTEVVLFSYNKMLKDIEVNISDIPKRNGNNLFVFNKFNFVDRSCLF